MHAQVLAAFANMVFASTVDALDAYHNTYDKLTWKDLVVSPSEFENAPLDVVRGCG